MEKNDFIMCVALIACMGLSVYDFYLNGQDEAIRQAHRNSIYCAMAGHSEVFCYDKE